MAAWLAPALDYLPRWLEFQVAQAGLPGASLAVVHDGALVLTHATGLANVATGERLTPAHRFRVASHSKTFTAAAVLRLVEAGRLRLDDRAGAHVTGLHKAVARATVAQLLSHTGGIIRDGEDAGQWADQRPFLNVDELRADLAVAPVIAANTRMKYSNHGFGLVGLIIEAVTGENYGDWIAREIVAASGLADTLPDAPLPARAKFARGHGTRHLLGTPFVIPADNCTNALAAATGFIATPADLARFFASLDPAAKRSVLSVESRREITRRLWRVPGMTEERHYGLGTQHGDAGAWAWCGHGGGFQGVRTHTVMVPGQNLAVSIHTNSADGKPNALTDGTLHILQTFAANGTPSAKSADWTGRFWGLWGATDLVAMGGKVLIASPGEDDPFKDAGELTPTGPDAARITRATGFGNYGQTASLIRDRAGRVSAVMLAGTRLLPREAAARDVRERYQPG